jgi:replicative DNA helicase
MLANVKAYEKVCEVVRPEHLAEPLYATVYEAIEAVYQRGRVPDAVAVRHDLAVRLATVSGLRPEDHDLEAGKLLGELLTALVGVVLAPTYAETIVEMWQRRQAVLAASELVEKASMTNSPIGETLGDGAGRFDDIRRTTKKHEVVGIATAVRSAVKAANDAATRGGVLGMRSGFSRFDRRIGGLHPGRLYYLGARPGMGKSALLQSWARGLAQGALRGDGGSGVVMFSAEMDAAFLGEREIAAGLNMDIERIGAGRLTDDDWIAADRFAAGLDSLPFWIDDRPRPTPEDMALSVRRLQRRHKIGVVMADHVHIMGVPKDARRAGRTEQVEAISMGLKWLAKECGVAVVAAAQLSRSVEEREDKRPRLDDLRQSGGLEQDADGVFFLYREGYYLERERPRAAPDAHPDDKVYKEIADWRAAFERSRDRAELIIAKNRGGRLDTIALGWDGSRTDYREADDGEG